MGQQVLAALCSDAEIDPVGCVDLHKDVTTVDLPGGLGSIPYASSVEDLLESVQADVLIDFSIASASFTAVILAVSNVVIKIVAIPKNHVDLCIKTSLFEFLKPSQIVYDKFELDIPTGVL